MMRTVPASRRRKLTGPAPCPHPDDEAIAAAATLLALRDSGHRVINLAVSLGRREQRTRRRRELAEACRRADFELVIHRPPLDISSGDDRSVAQRKLTATVESMIADRKVDLVVAPSPHDGHYGHEAVGRAARDAVFATPEARAPRLWLWGLWADLPWPTLYHGFDDVVMARAVHVLEAHEGELARNDYRDVLRGRGDGESSARLRARVRVGQREQESTAGGAAPGGRPPRRRVVDGRARELDPTDPLSEAPDGGRWRSMPIGWWLHAASFSDQSATRTPRR
jgi:LmbE family N-acetylglucosaminyl deacetylase